MMPVYLSANNALALAAPADTTMLEMRLVRFHIGDVVRKLREDRGWGQAKLSSVAGVSRATIQRLERGSSVGTDILAAVAGALDVTVADIFASTVERGVESGSKRHIPDDRRAASAG